MAPRVFTCSHCDYKHQYLSNVKTHVIRFHGKKGSAIHKCKFCGDISDSLATMNAHMVKCGPNVSQGSTKLENGKKLYDCWKCDYQSGVPGTMINHMIQVHNIPEPKIYKCPLCSQKFRTQRQLQIHEEDCTNVENDVITVISDLIPQKETFTINETVKIKLHKIDGPNENNPVSQLSKPKVKEKFKCLKCDFKAEQSFQLLKHVNMVHKINEPVLHKCRLCLQGFQNIMLLNSHIRTKCGTMVDVSKIKREEFKCSKCKYKTYRSHQLHRHMLMIHTENNGAIFKCKFCKEMFPNCQTLRTHSSICSKILKSDALPIKGIESKTKVKNGTLKAILSKKAPVYHNCPQCSYRTEHKNLLRSHKNSEHKKVSSSHLSAYTCEICKEGFQYITEFKPHVMKCKQINGVSNSETRRKIPTPRVSLDSATRKPVKRESFNSPSTPNSSISVESTVSTIKRERGSSFSNSMSSISRESDVPIKRERGSSFPTPISSISRVPVKREPNSPVSRKALSKNSPSKNHSVTKNAVISDTNNYVAKKSRTSVSLKIEVESEEEEEEDNENTEDCEDTVEDSEVEMFDCLSCSYRSKYSWAVRVHMARTHQINNPKIHKCKFCGIMLQHLRDLRYHVGKSYCVNTNADFARAKQAAEKIRRYNCSRCSYKAAYTHAIRGHMKRRHGMSGVVFKWCHACREVFMELEQFETHKCVKKGLKNEVDSEITEAKPFFGPFYVCSVCEKTFDTKDNFDTHRDTSECAKLSSAKTPEPFPKFIKLALRPLSKKTVRVLSSPKHSIKNIKMRNKESTLIDRACNMMTANKSKIATEDETTSSPQIHSNPKNGKIFKPSRTKPKPCTSSTIENEADSLNPEDNTQIEFTDNLDTEHKQQPISSESDFNVENHESENMLQEYLGVETIPIKKISLTDFSSPTPDFMQVSIATNVHDFRSSAIAASTHSYSGDADHDSSADDEKVFHEMTSFPPVDISYFPPDEMVSFPSSEMTCFAPGEMSSFLPDSAYYSINSEVGNTNADSGDTLFNTFEFYNDVDISKNMLVSDNSNDQPTNSNLNVNNDINSGLMINGDVTWNNLAVENGVAAGEENEFEFRL